MHGIRSIRVPRGETSQRVAAMREKAFLLRRQFAHATPITSLREKDRVEPESFFPHGESDIVPFTLPSNVQDSPEGSQ